MQVSNAWAGGGSFPQQQVQQMAPIQRVQNVRKSEVPKTSIEVKPKTDSFIQIVSDIPWWGIGLGVICLVIGGAVVLILLAKLTPLGQLITKAWNGLKSMFDALLKWKPKGK